MLTIWKYQLQIDDEQTIEMPKDAGILSLQTQYDEPCIWALLDPDKPKEPRTFRIFGTGHPIDVNTKAYIGSFQLNEGAFLGHVFEV